MKSQSQTSLFVALLGVAFTVELFAQPTAFTYQGLLTDGSGPANGVYDLQFTLKDAAMLGNTVGSPTSADDVGVTNGLFIVTLDFSATPFDGNARWLEIAVRPGASAGDYTNLAPRQAITATPYAIQAVNAMTVDLVTISNPSFIGTTNISPLELFVNNQRALRLEDNGDGSTDANALPDGAPNVIGGSAGNSVGAGVVGATIAGGGATNFAGIDRPLEVLSDYATIGGGLGNRIDSLSSASILAGGMFNEIAGNSPYSVINGGLGNNISDNAPYAVIAGGRDNAVGGNATNAFAAGRRARANHTGTFVWADATDANFSSTANNQFLIRAAGGVAVGTNDPAGAMLRVAGSIKADSFLGMVTLSMLGTTDNQPLQFKVNNTVGLRLEYPTTGTVPNLVGGFSGNSVGAGTQGAVIAGGGASVFENSIGGDSDYSAIGGGLDNNIAANSFAATIAGGYQNDIGVDSDYSAIGGGQINTIASNSWSATVAAGAFNDIGVDSDYSAIGGGFENNIAANSLSATIAGGFVNDIGVDSDYSAIGGGYNNGIAANCYAATIAGGVDNFIEAAWSAIGGGEFNYIASNARHAVIPGGYLNDVGAGATNAFAAGYRAKANHPGSFVWADSTDADSASTASNQFLIRAAGGVGIGLEQPRFPLHVGSSAGQGAINGAGQRSVVENSAANGRAAFLALAGPGTGFSSNRVELQLEASDNEHRGIIGTASNHELQVRQANIVRMTVWTNGFVGIGTGTPVSRLQVNGTVTATAFNPPSDRNLKENFAPVDPGDVLDRVTALRITRWNFKQDAATPHLGPMAQDFHAAFGLGTDDKHIATVDADGVALAAIQGLNQKLETKLKEKETEITGLKQRLEKLEQLLEHRSLAGSR